MKKEIIILTCSAKHGGYCVAGIDIDSYEWIRLVSSDNLNNNEIPKEFMYYYNSTSCKPLDVVSVEIIKKLPGDIQPENVLVDLGITPVYKYKLAPHELIKYISNDREIYKSTFPYMDKNTALNCGFSLALYQVKDIFLDVFEYNGRTKVKLNFTYNGCMYSGWSMTDPYYYGRRSGKICDNGLIVVSIPEDDYNGNYYKFVAKIIEL